MPAQLTDGHFAVLNRLSPAEAEDFVRLRRQMIADLIELDPGRHAELAALQDEIECQRALAGAPQQAIARLLPLLEQRVGELQRLVMELAREGAAPPDA